LPRSRVGVLSGNRPVHTFKLADNEYREFLEISVEDGGIGISGPNMAKLFQAFSQIDSSLARKFEGTGLGLAMVKLLAELHGGTVAVASAESEGARFVAWLPLRVAAHADPGVFLNAEVNADETLSLGARLTAVSQLKERIALVVEDDEMSADLIRLLLESEGFTVLVAPTAEAAMVIAPQQALSLITLDIQLPGIGGWEFLNRLRQDKALAHVPVVVIAGLSDPDITLSDGAASVLQKPISRAQLKSTLTDLGLDPKLGHTFNVLVVDDDPKAVEVIAAFLPAPTYTVLRAYGGGEAIGMAQRLRPDLILLDLMMPGVSGFDVVDALRRTPSTKDIPIVVVTAKQITPKDRAHLDRTAGEPVRIMEKAGFNRARFITEIRRALRAP